MKKILSIGLAAAMGAASIAVTVPAASAQPPGFQNEHVQKAGWRDRRHWRGKRHWRGNRHWRGRHRGWRHRHWRDDDDDWGAAAAGAIFGLTLGAIANQGYRGGNAHVRWCLNRYDTYNPRTDLYYYVPGRQRHCNSPYN